MKILQVNKFYYPKDGVSNYLIGIEAKLRELGHEVRVFAMDNPKNLPSSEQKYFVSYISFDQPGLINSWRALTRIFYSREAARKFAALIKNFRPDIIHLHNIYHQISPSILRIAKKEKIPVIMHLHDYKLICPNYKLFTQGNICQRCRGGKYYNCFWHKCLKNSYPKSLGGTLEMYFHHKLWKIYETGVKTFIAPSKFMKKTCEDFGWSADKIVWLNNFFKQPAEVNYPSEQTESNNYLLYFGRLAEEKGVKVLLQALTKNEENLKIVGEGPEELALKEMTKKLNLTERVEFTGFKSSLDLENIIKNAKAIIIPSVWYENMPLNLLESLAQGKIVIASNIGGIPEIIENGENGLLFKAGNEDDLVEKIKLLKTIDYPRMARAAKETVKHLDIDTHIAALLKIYETVLK